MKIAVILGTRPEIIKMAPVIRELESQKSDFFILHSGQHYSHNLDKIFFEHMELPQAKYNLETGSSSPAEQTARILIGVEKTLQLEKPDTVLVQGDTNTVLAGALGAVKLHIKIGHIEAGLRSYDRQMPEEINRIIADHCAELLFAPTEKARAILLSEGITKEWIFVTGNTVVDTIYQNQEIARDRATAINRLGLKPKGYFLATVHRQENVDNRDRLASILVGLNKVASEFRLPLIYPIHPHSRKMLDRFGLQTQNISLIEPLDYLNFLQLETNARLILTDSGGVQEEACILGVPCITLRDNTERPETISVGANILVGTTPQMILGGVQRMINNNQWKNPFGDGRAAKKIVEILKK